MRQYNVTHCQEYDKANKRDCIDQNARQTAMSYEGKGRVNKKEAIALYNGGLQVKEIAEKYEVRPSAISNMIARYKAEQDTLAEYRDNKASIMEHIQGKLLSSVSEDDPKSAQQLVTSAAILEDKIRLERGQATVNTTVDIRMLIASLPDQAAQS